ncbi:acyl-CoA N-acyltransferase [Aspergillus pseudonomiae]|uniref:Acyl-CoA N-acyltransferase n=1 Tax=Aspergillus pseudonomiae TaxID=1506151 RepID=A0A5N7DQZ5_9EURO|nr:acyl-CoA N-acyltransferase [Aspergillus pseudonomiae]KAB8263599.1 acyl-CoA N-acyltransferase [Aspergillus pseudonomiae]KAE8408463.1 acyl-CoA N-acyltransferase [Aspergillus pseudonomiae]
MTLTEVHLRPAVSQDLPAIAEVAAQSMLDDELFAFLCPRRREYYSDYRQSFLRRLRAKLTSPGWVVIVAVAERSMDADSCPILGYCVWERIGDTAEESTKQWKETSNSGWWARVQELLGNASEHFVTRLYPDRSVDVSRLARYNALTIECFPYDDFPELWFLSTLAVHPAYQRQGIGRRLVEWGLEHATWDGTPVGLEASAKGTSLYQSLGFQVVNEVPLVEGVALTAMLWRPSRVAHP